MAEDQPRSGEEARGLTQADQGQEDRAEDLGSELQRSDSQQPNSQLVASFQGPLPPPGLLKGYGDIQQDFPERILALTEREAAHRHEIEATLAKGSVEETRRGQRYALVVAVLVLLVAALAVFVGEGWVAAAIAGGTLVSLVAVFIAGRALTDSDEDK